jgi:hypothetical protein
MQDELGMSNLSAATRKVAPDLKRTVEWEPNRPEDFLSPEQRWDAISRILATVALRVMRQSAVSEKGDSKRAGRDQSHECKSL